MDKNIDVFTTDLMRNIKLEKVNNISFKIDSPGNDGREDKLINVYDQVTYQEILGFGGALTEATVSNLCAMPSKLREKTLDLLFDQSKGIGMNFCRSTINSCDFSEDFYTYDDVDGDMELKFFDIAHDKEKIIPVIKNIMEKYGSFKLLCSPWSPPAWMKTNKNMSEGGKVRKECLGVWSKYIVKFIKACKEEGIPIWGITIQNEAKAKQGWESCTYLAEEEREFAENFLIPDLINSKLEDIKVLCWDHNKERALDRAMDIIGNSKKEKKVDGIALHWYSGDHFRALEAVHTLFPDKYIISTEQSQSKHNICYESGERYAHDMIGNLNNWANAWIDWNMVLDEDGGPDHWKDEQKRRQIPEDKIWVGEAPIVYNKKEEALELRSSYYYMGHLCKFVRPGAKRIASSCFDDSIETVSFKNLDGSIVCVVLNRSDKKREFALRYREMLGDTFINPHSINTYVW